MNYQKDLELGIGRKEACQRILEVFPDSEALEYYMDYYAYPQTFSSTAGPFKGRIAGQAFCTYTVEAWVFGRYALLFCNGKEVIVTDKWLGIGTVRI